jgi:hypothetical protein
MGPPRPKNNHTRLFILVHALCIVRQLLAEVLACGQRPKGAHTGMRTRFVVLFHRVGEEPDTPPTERPTHPPGSIGKSWRHPEG